MRHSFDIGGVRHEAWLARIGQGYVLHDRQGSAEVALCAEPGGQMTLSLDGARIKLEIATAGNSVFVHLAGETLEICFRDAVDLHAADAGGAASDVARAPMPGSVLQIPVAEGDTVRRGETLVVIESMKIEVAIKAERDGVVAAIHTAPGRSFDRDAILVTLAAVAEG